MKIWMANKHTPAWFLVSLLTATSLPALTLDSALSRYSNIISRNTFGLKPPEPVRVVEPPKPLPKVVLSGITTILHDKRVLLKVLPVAAKPGEQAKELYLVLAQGQREADIEIREINEMGGSVSIINSGTPMTLTFDQDGAKLPPGAPPGAPPFGAPPGGHAMPAMAGAPTNAPVHFAAGYPPPRMPTPRIREALGRAAASGSAPAIEDVGAPALPPGGVIDHNPPAQ
jgi:hypothetical protein